MDNPTFFFGGWEVAARVIFITTLGYVSIVLLLRVSGKRPLSQMTAFDFVIAVTLGSAFGRVVTATEVGIVEAVVGFGTLISLQVFIAWVQQRWRGMRHVFGEEAALLYRDGEFLRRAMKRHGIVEEDLWGVVRQEGLGSFDQAAAIILERNGKFSVLTHEKYGDGSVLEGLAR